MISISSIVKETVKNSPFLREALSLGILNHSALARFLKPRVEKKLLKKVSLESLVIALSRIEKNLKKEKKFLEDKLKKVFRNKVDLILRTDLVEYSFLNSPNLINKLFNFFDKEEFFVFSRGSAETTIVFHSKNEKKFKKVMEKEKVIKKIENLASISICLPEKVLDLPGVYYFFLSLLAFEGINVIEIFSTFRELTLLLENKKVARAFEILKDFFSFS